MIGDDRDPRPDDFSSFAERAGYSSFVAYPGSEYTILPDEGGQIVWGGIIGAVGDLLGIVLGGSGSSRPPSQRTIFPEIPAPTLPGGIIIPPSTTIPGTGPDRGDYTEGSIYEENPQPETDWDEVYRQYQILNEGNAPVQTDEYERDDNMAIDWGGLANLGIDFLQGQTGGTGYAPSQTFLPDNAGLVGPVASPTPRTVTIDTVTGKVTKCKRRRRRRLLTEGDFNDLMRISTLPNKENVRIALAKSIGRR